MAYELELKEAKRIFEEVVEVPRPERGAFLDRACASDASLRRRVESMLREFESGSFEIEQSFFDRLERVSETAGAFTGTTRFALQRQLGSGAFGTVYQAWDRERHVRVALKVLHTRRPELLFRFKHEFRVLVNVRHPNVIRLYELFSESEQWFFSMELVEGETFLQYVRPEGGPCDLERLRPALSQLVQAVQALHATKLLHRDLKPANALVTHTGRVVVLDFGLVRQLDSSSERSTQIVGTPAYMAPEQALENSVSEAADWYSVGVMLYQALTGKLPYASSMLSLLSSGQLEPCTEARELQPETPEDLNALASALLRRRPEERPTGAAILSVLTPTAVVRNETLAEPRGEIDRFVGRTALLRELDEAFSSAQEGNFCAVLMHGRSGIGKTALAKRLLAILAERDSNLLVLKGRCYEFESVPYKGLDSLVDELSRWLQRLPEARAEALLPRDAFLLPKLFPVLGMVSAIAKAPARSIVAADAQELRQLTFSALRELLTRLSDRQPVVIWIDDLQWGDRDTSTFLAELCISPQQPPLLMLLTYRSEELASNATLHHLHTVLSNQRVLKNWRQIAVDKLSDLESRELLEDLLPGKNLTQASLSRIVAESGGHPLFLHQLAHFATSGSAGLSADVICQGGEFKLQTVLLERLAELEPFTRELLEFVCVGAQPLSPAVLFATVDASGGEADRSEALALLIRQKFARSSGSSDERRVEPFHDQVRTAVIHSLAPEILRQRHAGLARVLSLQPDIEPQLLVTHYQQAGNLQAAHHAALQAARAAEEQLAFERAAVFYQAALETADIDGKGKAELNRKLADALGMAGRGRDSALAYLRAADCGGPESSFDLQRLAADQLMRSGHVDEALELFERLAKKVGVRFVHSSGEAVRGLVLARLRARWRLITGFPKARTGATVSAEQMAKLDLLRTGGIILTTADPTLAAYFQTQHIVEALRVREPVHLATAFAVESSVRVAVGMASASKAWEILNHAEQIAKDSGNPNALGLIYLAQAYLDYLLCRVDEGIAHSRHAIQFFREHCTGVAWELTAAYVLLLWFLCWAGQVREVREHLPQLLKEGAARGDVNMEVSLRLLSHSHYWYLSLDQPDECIQDFQAAIGRWSRRGYHLQHYSALFAFAESALYLGNYSQARQYLVADWKTMSRSFILRWRTLVIRALFLKGRSSLACWLEDPSDQALRAEVEQCARRLKRIRSPWSPPMHQVLRAGLLAGEGNSAEAALHLEAAAKGFEAESLHAFAAAARYFCGRIRDDARGRDMVDSAKAFLDSQQVMNPTAFLRMLLPGRWTAGM